MVVKATSTKTNPDMLKGVNNYNIY